jgi:hypothetical protein
VPHRIRTSKLSNDAKFADKLRDIVGLYVDPPTPFSSWSTRRARLRPMKKGRAGTMTHDYKHNGTTTLFAALNVLDGTVISRTPSPSGPPSTASSRKTMPTPSPSSGPQIPTVSSPLSNGGSKS